MCTHSTNYVLLLENNVVEHQRIRAMVFNATFSNISVISWQSVLLTEEIGLPKETHRSAASYFQALSHDVVSSAPRHEWDSNSQRCFSFYFDVAVGPIGGGNPSSGRKTTLKSLTNYHQMLYQVHLSMSRNQNHKVSSRLSTVCIKYIQK